MEQKKLTIKDSALSFIAGFLLSQLGVVIITMLCLFAFKLCKLDMTNFEGFFNTCIGYLIASMTLYLVIVLVFIFFNKGKDNKITSKINLKKLLLYIFIAITSFFCLYPIITCIDSLLVKLGAPINTLSYPLTTRNYFISFIPLVILPAVCEELLFRGIIFKGLKPHGKVFAIVMSSVMFSIFHMAISQTVYPILIGILLAVIMFYENNIYYCIAIHLTNNFLSLTFSYFNISLIFNHWTYILLAIVLLMAFITIVLYFVFKDYKKYEKVKIEKNDLIVFISIIAIMLLFWLLVNFV